MPEQADRDAFHQTMVAAQQIRAAAGVLRAFLD
jgi:hypothetical protein